MFGRGGGGDMEDLFRYGCEPKTDELYFSEQLKKNLSTR